MGKYKWNRMTNGFTSTGTATAFPHISHLTYPVPLWNFALLGNLVNLGYLGNLESTQLQCTSTTSVTIQPRFL